MGSIGAKSGPALHSTICLIFEYKNDQGVFKLLLYIVMEIVSRLRFQYLIVKKLIRMCPKYVSIVLVHAKQLVVPEYSYGFKQSSRMENTNTI